MKTNTSTPSAIPWRFCFVALCFAFVWASFSFAFRPFQPQEAFSPLALVTFHAPLPQGKRLFSLALVRLLFSLGLPLGLSFFLAETAAATALACAFHRVFSGFLDSRRAALPALASLALPAFVFPYGYYQPWDTWSMSFVAWALAFILEARFIPLLVLMPFASLNHETAALISLLFLALHFDRLPFLRRPRATLWIFLALLAIHAAVLALASRWAAPRVSAPFYDPADMWAGMVLRHSDTGVPDFNWNHSLRWLRGEFSHPFALLYSLAFLPLSIALFSRFLVPESRRLLEVAFFHGVSVFLAGLLFETRCFAATVAILYPVAVVTALRALRISLHSPLDALPPPSPALRRLSPCLEVAALLALVVLAALFMRFPPLPQ